MYSNLTSMTNKNLCNRIVFPIIHRHASATARSFLVRFIEDRRTRIQQDDIRLEPYMSKGVYTESGAIRPVNRTHVFQLFIYFF
jgi:hypothetical protein